MRREEDEITRMIEEAKNRPGIADLLATLGQYEAYLRDVDAYFKALRPQFAMTTTDSTS